MRLNEIFAQHYQAVATLLRENLLLLDRDKYSELIQIMDEASRCLCECSDRLNEK